MSGGLEAKIQEGFVIPSPYLKLNPFPRSPSYFHDFSFRPFCQTFHHVTAQRHKH